MHGFEHVFAHSVKVFAGVSDPDSLFANFRNHKDIYGYICNEDSPPDQEAIEIARSMNPTMTETYLNVLKTRKILGYTGIVNHPFHNDLDSRHIMMSVICFDTIKEPLNHVIEIGGGFGNWLFLNQNIGVKRWTIIDLPHVGRLQRWCLTQQNISPDTYDIVSALAYDNVGPGDLVIGSHSLSELSFNTFKSYFDKVIRNSKYLFYAFNNYSLSSEMLRQKLEIIHTAFDRVISVSSENGNVINTLYNNRIRTK
jgi:hypothetical protein